MTRLPQSALWAIRDDRTLSAYAKSAYVMLWTRGKDAHPSLQTLGGDMGTSRATAKRAVQELERAGLAKRIPRLKVKGDSDSNRYELLPVPEGWGQRDPTPGHTDPTGGVSQTPEDRTLKQESEGRKSRASRLARPAVSRAADQIELVRQAVALAGWDMRELEDEDALDVWDRFVTQRKAAAPLADPVKYLAGIFASFVSLDGVLSNTPERE